MYEYSRNSSVSISYILPINADDNVSLEGNKLLYSVFGFSHIYLSKEEFMFADSGYLVGNKNNKVKYTLLSTILFTSFILLSF